MREAYLFVVALLGFILGGLFWQFGALIAFPLLLLGLVRLVQYFRSLISPLHAGIAQWPPLSRQDRCVARAKLNKYK